MQNRVKPAKTANVAKANTEQTIGGNKIYTGPRGGKYIFVYCNKNKKKKYVK